MFFSPKVVRRVSENCFEDGEAQASGRHLRWNLRFRYINVELVNPEIRFTSRLHDHDIEVRRVDTPEPSAIIHPVLKNSISITGTSPSTDRGDRFGTIKQQEGQTGDVFTTEALPTGVEVTLREGDPLSERSGRFAAGCFAGSVMLPDPEFGPDCVSFELFLPKAILEELAARLSSTHNSITVRIGFAAHTYEVDDALRQWYHPEAFLLPNTTDEAFLVSASTWRKLDPTDAVGKPMADPGAAENQLLQAPPLRPTSETDRLPLAAPLWAIAALLLLLVLR